MASKEEYLKRYLSGPSKRKKKGQKDKKSKEKTNSIRVIDIDADVALPDEVKRGYLDVEFGEDGPVVALVDVGVDELQLLGKFKTDTWRTVDDKPSNEREARKRYYSSDEDEAKPKESGKSTARKRHDSDRDEDGPSEKPKTAEANKDASPLRRVKTEPAGSDQSLVRRASDGDQSPPRKRKQSSDFSPPRRTRKSSPDSPRRKREESSSSRKRRRSSSDQSVERKPRKPTHTLAGASAGLQTASKLREESKKLKAKEEAAFSNIKDEVSGRQAETVFRDRATGRKRDLKKDKELTEEEKKRQKELKEKYELWNKGVKQLQSREVKLKDMAKVAEKPLARYEGDKDLEKHLKSQERKEDPMFQFMQKKKQRKDKVKGKTKYPTYAGPAPPPNRYQICPGYRWDGVDRSNGFENKMLSQRNLRQADETEYYMWQTGTYE